MEIGWERRNKIYKIEKKVVARLFKEFLSKNRVESIEFLTGGLSNTNYKVHLKGYTECFVLRIYTREASSWNKEVAIFKLLQEIVPIPQLVYASDDKGIIPENIAIFKFIEGQTLAQLMHNRYEPGERLMEELGEKLALIHQFQYNKMGFLGNDIGSVESEEPISKLIENYAIEPLINGPARNRIGYDKAERLIEFLKTNNHLLNTSQPAVLTHGDFKPTNLLINRKNKLVGILDWEFAFSGPCFFDMGQMLRYEDELPGSFSNHFINGYQRNSKHSIQPNWKRLAKLVDLINLIGFLNLAEERPKMVVEVKTLIHKTMHNWHYH